MIQNCAPRVRRSAARPAPSGSRSCHAGFGDWCPLEPYNALPHRSDTQKNQANHFMATSGANVGKGNRRTSHAAVWTILLSCGGGELFCYFLPLICSCVPHSGVGYVRFTPESGQRADMSECCSPLESGTSAAPPSSVMNSRRFIALIPNPRIMEV